MIIFWKFRLRPPYFKIRAVNRLKCLIAIKKKGDRIHAPHTDSFWNARTTEKNTLDVVTLQSMVPITIPCEMPVHVACHAIDQGSIPQWGEMLFYQQLMIDQNCKAAASDMSSCQMITLPVNRKNLDSTIVVPVLHIVGSWDDLADSSVIHKNETSVFLPGFELDCVRRTRWPRHYRKDGNDCAFACLQQKSPAYRLANVSSFYLF